MLKDGTCPVPVVQHLCLLRARLSTQAHMSRMPSCTLHPVHHV